MPIGSAQELIAHKLHHIEDAETEASAALRQLMNEAQDDELKQLLQQRMHQGEALLNGVRQARQRIGGQTPDEPNRAALGLIEEGQTVLRMVEGQELKQAVMIGAVQSLEHYCIAVWGTVKALARQMGDQQLVELMERALEDGKALDRQLTELAESRVNPEAMTQGGQQQSMGEPRSFAGADSQGAQMASAGAGADGSASQDAGQGGMAGASGQGQQPGSPNG